MDFKISVNVADIAEKLNKNIDEAVRYLHDGIHKIVISTHAFILKKAESELSGFMLKSYLGPNGEYLRWHQISDGIWVVELDERANWIESGRPATSMATPEWLLKPNKSKTAKDGSRYRPIPFVHTVPNSINHLSGTEKILTQAIKTHLKQNKISLRTPVTDPSGAPRLGVIQKLHIPDLDRKMAHLYSRPRTPEEAALTGLKPHNGIFYLKNAILVQRAVKRGSKTSIKKEVVVFRTVSSKHLLEHRWVYPEVKPFNAFEAAYEWAQKQVESLIDQIDTVLKDS